MLSQQSFHRGGSINSFDSAKTSNYDVGNFPMRVASPMSELRILSDNDD